MTNLQYNKFLLLSHLIKIIEIVANDMLLSSEKRNM